MPGIISGEPVLSIVFRRLAPFLETSAFGKRLLSNYRSHKPVYFVVEKILLCYVLIMLVRFFLIQPFHIPSDSMTPALAPGDRIFIYRLPYLYNSIPDRGDIIVFRPPRAAEEKDGVYYVKRVVGLPGDVLSIRKHRLYVDGRRVVEPKVFRRTVYYSPAWLAENADLVTVPESTVFVLGDNSRDSSDSRVWGPVPLSKIEGEVFFRFWPMTRLGIPE